MVSLYTEFTQAYFLTFAPVDAQVFYAPACHLLSLFTLLISLSLSSPLFGSQDPLLLPVLHNPCLQRLCHL